MDQMARIKAWTIEVISRHHTLFSHLRLRMTSCIKSPLEHATKALVEQVREARYYMGCILGCMEVDFEAHCESRLRNVNKS